MGRWVLGSSGMPSWKGGGTVCQLPHLTVAPHVTFDAKRKKKWESKKEDILISIDLSLFY